MGGQRGLFAQSHCSRVGCSDWNINIAVTYVEQHVIQIDTPGIRTVTLYEIVGSSWVGGCLSYEVLQN